MVTEAQIRQDFGLGADSDGLLFVSPDDALASDQLRGQSHYIRRAFERLRLDGVFCIDGISTIYLKKYERPVGRREINELQSKLWNQSTGTLLVILDPNFVYIFSSMVHPSQDEGDIEAHPALVETLHRVVKTLDMCDFVTRVASGHYYREHSHKFQQSNTVDKHLLDNLGTIGNLLRRNTSINERRRVHSFIGRIIFLCYLIDRGIIELERFWFVRKNNVSTLLDLLESYESDKAVDLLYKLFDKLRVDFNGSMFETDFEEEKATITDIDIKILIRFLRGDELKRGQQTLGFWAYDFSVIPVETISAIYEKFLEEEDSIEKGQQGAFYTPKHLAEMVVNEATSDIDSLIDKRCLDPACGSGIFLVIIFNRIAEEYLRDNPRSFQKTRFEFLQNVLENQICGVDVNKTACRITCFSLYIAFLDQFAPRILIDLQKKLKKKLPRLLAYKDASYENTNTPVIYEGNFFDSRISIGDAFDIIVGNPPWVGRNQSVDPDVMQWIENKNHNRFLADSPKGKAKRDAIFLPQKQIAHAFMWKTLSHLKKTGRISLLLPVQVLLNKTDAFQQSFFSKVAVNRVFNLSDFRLFLFQDAKRPTMIIQFSMTSGDESNRMIEYVVPKVRNQDPRAGLIRIFPEDVKWVRNKDVLEASQPQLKSSATNPNTGASVFWKSLQWGTPRDLALIDYLRSLDNLGDIAGDRNENKRWIKGQGFQPFYQASYEADPKYGAPEPIPGNLNDPFIETLGDSLQVFVLPVDTITLRERLESLRCRGRSHNIPEEKLKASLSGFHRARDKRLYTPPVVLINKGFSKCAFLDFKAFYQHSLAGISGDEKDANLLRFLVAYLKSDLADYFSFHTAGSRGTERTEVRIHELMRLPFPLPDSQDSHKDAKSIVNNVAQKMKEIQKDIANDFSKELQKPDYELSTYELTEIRQERVDKLLAEVEPLVYRYFMLTDEEITLIKDTCKIISQSATPQSPSKRMPTTQPTTISELMRYSKLLCSTLNMWSKLDQPKGVKQPFYFRAEVIPLSSVGLNLLTLHQAQKPASPVQTTSSNQLEHVVDLLHKSSSYKRGSFQYFRGVIFGDGNKIHIFKPDMLGQWMETSALNDADQIFNAIIQSKRQR